jgi:Capsule assembly protein Wzi/PAP2 superfamily
MSGRITIMVITAAWLGATTVSPAWPQSEPESTVRSASNTVAAENTNATSGAKRAPALSSSSTEDENYSETRLGTSLLKNLALDQRDLWTSPAKLRFSDADWLVPAGGLAAGLFVTDRDTSLHLSHNLKTINRYNTISNAGLGALIGGAGGLWLLGHARGDEHWSETGLLAGEAVLDSLAVVEGLKYSLRRQRPFEGDGSGSFLHSGTSFPSEHAAAAWAVAGILAHEYPGPLTKILAYGLASAVSYSRVRGRQHFSSDVFVGGILGDLVGQQIYTRHHDANLGGAEWGSIGQLFHGEGSSSPGNQGSPYVPLDSWVYPVFDRLIALGRMPTGTLGQRPWTRLECARLVEEANDVDGEANSEESPEVRGSLGVLRKEFAGDLTLLEGGENRGVRLESVYTRWTGISGPPLHDSYHFGQTLINDYGRPYQEGVNNVSGISGWATHGRWIAYVRGEYQYAPSGPAYSDTVRNFIAQADAIPLQPASAIPAQNQFRLLDAYVGLTLNNWQVTYGQQSLWWGPGKMGPFLLSNDAAPVRLIRLNRTTPIELPWLFRYLGPVHMDAFFGSLEGHQFPPNPVIHGEKISFKPTPNLEFGFSRTVVLGGAGRPLTPASFFNSYVSVTSSANETPGSDPGKRSGGFDFSYRVPFLRNWLTVYADSISDDDPSPLANPPRAGINPGIYLPQFPGLRKLDLRLEAAYTDVPSGDAHGGHFIYFDGFYHDLYTNKGQLLGNWVGRDGKGLQAWSRYWVDARTFLEFAYRHGEVSDTFVPGGGNINDGSIRAGFWLHRVWNVTASLQWERWNFPILALGPQTNVTSSVGITFSPVGGRP